MRRFSALAVTLPSLLAATPATARAHDEGRDRVELHRDHHEIRQDRRALHDDWRDLERMERRIAQFDQARARRDLPALNGMDFEVARALQQEIDENRRELARAEAEVRQGRREVRSERREVARDLDAGRPGAAAKDRRDLHDNRRDLRDDRFDAERERQQLVRLEGIAGEWNTLRGHLAPPALDRKRALLAQLADLARAEVAADRRELHEDRHEMREDRRERAEDHGRR